MALLAPAAYSQLQPGFQQSTAPALRMGRYDKSSEVVNNGTVASIGVQRNGTLPRGTYLVLHSGALTLNVQMGLLSPASVPFAVGDQVQVIGSIASIRGQQVLLARQVQFSGKTLTVRSAHGFVLRPRPASQSQSLNQGTQP